MINNRKGPNPTAKPSNQSPIIICVVLIKVEVIVFIEVEILVLIRVEAKEQIFHRSKVQVKHKIKKNNVGKVDQIRMNATLRKKKCYSDMNRWIASLFACATWAISLSFSQAHAQTGTLVALRHTAAGLALTHTDVAPFSLNVLTDGPISSDGYPSGVADIDCFGERFFYVRGIPQRLVTADAVTGELISQVLVDNPLDADVRLSNIAYDWTDDRLIGTAATTSALGNTNLHLVEVDPATGAVDVLSNAPATGATHGSGNCDLDAAGNRYYLLGTDRLFTWDALSGELLGWTFVPDLDSTASGQTLTHLAHHPLENALYALHKREPDSFDPNGPWFQSELRLARKSLPDGEWEFVSGEVLSMDGIQSGQCDIDPYNNRFYYVQDGKVRVVDTESGTLLFTLNTSSTGIISEWANVQFHDLSTPAPATTSIAVADTVWVEWDGVSPMSLGHGLGGMLDGAWSDGPGFEESNGNFSVSAYGGMNWTGTRIGANGGSITVVQHYEIIPEVAANVQGPLANDLSSRVIVSPNPCRPGDQLHVPGATGGTWQWIALGTGRQMTDWAMGQPFIIPDNAPAGSYILVNRATGLKSAPFLVVE